MRNMTAALGRFGHARRGDNFTGELIHRTDIHQFGATLLIEDGKDLIFVCADRLVRFACMIWTRYDLWHIGCECTLFRDPLLAATIDEPNVPVAVILQLPEGVGGKPIVIVTIEQNRGVIGDPRFS